MKPAPVAGQRRPATYSDGSREIFGSDGPFSFGLFDSRVSDQSVSPGPLRSRVMTVGDHQPEPVDDIARQENVKHLEMIQSIVTRLASNSFLIKAWTVTLATAAFGISINRADWRLSIIGVAMVIAFWGLDSYFLRQERLFRLLYDYVRSEPAVPRFAMQTIRFNARVHRRAVFFSTTLVILYGSLVLAGLGLAGVDLFTR